VAAPNKFSTTAKEAYAFVEGLGVTSPQEIISAVTRYYAGRYGFQDQVAIGQIVNQLVAISDWESGLGASPSGDNGNSWGLFHANFGGRGAGYTKEQLLDPINNSILAVEEMLPMAIRALASGMDYGQMADVLVRQGQRPDPKNVQAVNNMVASVQAVVGDARPTEQTVQAAGTASLPEGVAPTTAAPAGQGGGEGGYGGVLGGGAAVGGGGAGTEGLVDAEGYWTDEAVLAFTGAGLSDTEAEDAELLLGQGLLPGPTLRDAFAQYGELLSLADAAGVPQGELWTMLRGPVAQGEESWVGQKVRQAAERAGVSPAPAFDEVRSQLGLRALQAGAERLGLSGADLQRALSLGLTEGDIGLGQANGWGVDRTAQLRDEVARKGMTLSQAVANGYVDQVIERERLTAVGGGDIQAGLELENRLFRTGESVEDYVRRRLTQGASPQEIERSITAQGGSIDRGGPLWGRLGTKLGPLGMAFRASNPGWTGYGGFLGPSGRTTAGWGLASEGTPTPVASPRGGPPEVRGGEAGWASPVQEMLAQARMTEAFLGANRPLGTQTASEAQARRQAIIAANPQIAGRMGLLPARTAAPVAPTAVPAAPKVKPPAKGAIPGEGRVGKLPSGQRPPPSTTAQVPANLLPPPARPPEQALPLTMGELAAGLKAAYGARKKKPKGLLPVVR